MSNYQELQQQFAQNIINALPSSGASIDADTVNPLIGSLIKAMPYYNDPNWDTAHRGALVNLVEASLPNDDFSVQPVQNGPGSRVTYYYAGSYSGYQDAFFSGVSKTDVASNVEESAKAANSDVSSSWWGNYSVVLLTDAIRIAGAASLDTSKLSSDLESYNSSFLSVMSASYLSVFTTGYSPTMSALSAIYSANLNPSAYSQLKATILDGQFTANMNQVLSEGGDKASAATWFLFNLWITLDALGSPDMDNDIQQFQNAGLNVPTEIGPTNWWNGTYDSWFVPLSGSDVSTDANDTIQADMPENFVTQNSGGQYTGDYSWTNGYVQSFCYLSSHNGYIAPSSSCFGKGTGVLMADGKVKPIEQIKIGDQVMSDKGPRRVILVESPLRAGRTLYQINGLDLLPTSAHPLRTARGTETARVAMDPWALMDTIPHLIEQGIGQLKQGVQLQGRDKRDSAVIPVENITPQKANNKKELVYDLILDSWVKDSAAYYVGGPDLFVATDAETSNPLYNLACTTAIGAAMQEAIQDCRQNLKNPGKELQHLTPQLDSDKHIRHALKVAKRPGKKRIAKHFIPRVDFFMEKGKWDAHASMLEVNLIRQFSRKIRRELTMGWRARPGISAQVDHYVLTVHDLELLGDFPVPANTPLEIAFQVRGWDRSQHIDKKVTLAANAKPRWHFLLDELVNFGSIHKEVRPASLTGTIHLGTTRFGHFRVAFSEERLKGSQEEHFIFNDEGKIIGRIAIEHRRVAYHQQHMEKYASKSWKRQQTMFFAINFGRELGRELAALCRTVS